MLRRSLIKRTRTLKAKPYRPRSTRKGYIAILDDLVSQYVRRLYQRCVTCGTTTDLTASHFYSRRWLNVRWDLRNVTCQCARCNAIHNESAWPYLNWFLNTYSDHTLEELFALRNSTKKVTDEELKELIKDFRQKLKGMG